MDRYATIVLAALLHDIGKFWQRTGQRHGPGYDQGDYGEHGAHAKWSADFVERFLPAEWKTAVATVLFHHKPRDLATKVVTAADWLSSGERDDADVHAGQHTSQLRSLFSRLTLHVDETPAPAHHYALAPLSPASEAIFPREAPLSESERRDAYRRLWDGFAAELARVPRGDPDAYLETLYYLLQKYTWCVPSAFYRSVPDVSLFDHARTTAAIAAALLKSEIDEAELDALLARESAAWRAERLMLLGADITRIQAFLYAITAKGAGRGLRGRSFYLQLVAEAIARWVLRQLGLPPTNLLYVGGGRFYLLTHRLDADRLLDLRR